MKSASFFSPALERYNYLGNLGHAGAKLNKANTNVTSIIITGVAILSNSIKCRTVMEDLQASGRAKWRRMSFPLSASIH